MTIYIFSLLIFLNQINQNVFEEEPVGFQDKKIIIDIMHQETIFRDIRVNCMHEDGTTRETYITPSPDRSLVIGTIFTGGYYGEPLNIIENPEEKVLSLFDEAKKSKLESSDVLTAQDLECKLDGKLKERLEAAQELEKIPYNILCRIYKDSKTLRSTEIEFAVCRELHRRIYEETNKNIMDWVAKANMENVKKSIEIFKQQFKQVYKQFYPKQPIIN
jgi:hypothetical protein